MKKRILALVLTLSLVLGTGGFAAMAADPDSVTTMELDTKYIAQIEEAGDKAYFSFTPETSGTYQFYSVGKYDTYSYLYDSDWECIDYDDDSGSNTNTLLEQYLVAGETYYVAFEFYDGNFTGHFAVYVEMVSESSSISAISAELYLTEDLVLFEGMKNSYYEDDGNVYYDVSGHFNEGDYIVITFDDGSTAVYTCDGYGDFCDDEWNYIYYTVDADSQYDDPWEPGGTYSFEMTVYYSDYEFLIDVPISVIENPYRSSITAMQLDTKYTATISEKDAQVYYSYTPKTSGYYRFYTTGDYDTYSYFYDSDWNCLTYDDDGGSGTNTSIRYYLEAGKTYYVGYRFYSRSTTGSFSVQVEEFVSITSVEVKLTDDLTLIEGIDSYTNYDDNDEEYEHYSLYDVFNDGDQVIVTYEDGSTETYTYSDGEFYNEDGEYLDYGTSSDQYENHWELGGTYDFTLIVYDADYEDSVYTEVSVTIVSNPHVDATAKYTGDITLEYYEYQYTDDDGETHTAKGITDIIFSDGAQITITTADGEELIYTCTAYEYTYYYSGELYSYDYYEFCDENGNYLSWYYYLEDVDDENGASEEYYVCIYLSDYGISIDYTDVLYTRTYNDVTAVEGSNRYATASAIVQQVFESSEYAVVTTGTTFPDALAAASLAGTLDAPILITSDSAVSSTIEELDRLGVSTVYIVGGTSSVSSSVETKIKEEGITVERLAGSNRQATALAVAQEVLKLTSGNESDVCFVATGATFADALSASAYSYYASAPIYLTKNDGSISDEVLSAIKAGGYSEVVIVGGTSSVSAATETALAAIADVTRLGGTNRYESSALIAEWSVERGMSYDDAVIATGTNYPDALVASALCGQKGSVLLLSAATAEKSTVLESVIEENNYLIYDLYVVGGTSSVSNEIREMLETALNIHY